MGCGPKFSGVLYFYSFFLIMSLILLKLFIAIIIEAYNEIKKRDGMLFNEEKIDKFILIWQKFDPDVSTLYFTISLGIRSPYHPLTARFPQAAWLPTWLFRLY